MAQVYQDYDAFAVDTPADDLPIFSDPSNQYDVKNVTTGNFAGNVIRRNTSVNDIEHRLIYDEQAVDIAQPFELQHTYEITNASGNAFKRIYLGYSGAGSPTSNSTIQIIWEVGSTGLRLFIGGSLVAQDSTNRSVRNEPNRLWITFDGSMYRVYTQKGTSLEVGDSKPSTPSLSYESAAVTGLGAVVVLQQQWGTADFYNLGVGTNGDPAPTEPVGVGAEDHTAAASVAWPTIAVSSAVTHEQLSEATASASLGWPAIGVSVSAAHDSDEISEAAASVAWPAISTAATATIEDPPDATATASTAWPAISLASAATHDDVEGASAATSVAWPAISVSGAATTAEPASATAAALVAWPALSVSAVVSIDDRMLKPPVKSRITTADRFTSNTSATERIA